MSTEINGNIAIKHRGRVLWFSNAKGFGFIAPGDDSADIFVHYTAIQMNGHRVLQADQIVEYEIERTAKGSKAVNVKVVN